MLKTARENLWLKGFKISNRVGCELEITHLQYADDTLIFCDANKEQLRMLRVIFILFEAVSGLHINWNKSFLYPVNVVPDLSSLAGTLGGRIGDLPTTYLGMPLGANSRSLGIWNGVIEKCERRLVNWKSQYLSLGGRLTLINSVLDSMPNYVMSLFPIPNGVIGRLNALRRNFLWEGNSKTKKFHLVKWAALIGNKQVGGLGVRNLKTQNQCLLMKWLWRLASNEQALWKEVIQAKYEMEDHWSTCMVTNTYGTSLWRTIRKLWPKLRGNCKIKIGNGVKVSFWEDSWLEQGPLKTLFPDVFILNQQQRDTVAEVWSNQGWNLSFRRPFNDWEIQRVVEFYRTLKQFRGGNTAQDCLEWKDHKQGRFSVKGAYKKFNPFNSQINGWPWKMIWKAKIPYKVSCFTWLLAKQAVLTQENLMKRGIQLRPRCFLCGEKAETVSHLFLHCRITNQLWDLFINKKGLKWVMPRRVTQTLKIWSSYANISGHRERWKIIPACIWWSTWKERNLRCHQNKSNTIQKMKMNCLVMFHFWCKQEYMEDLEAVVNVLGSL
ncbi:hypothetical protein RDI58_004258 [Solanum bulbocastanum]|uniref:Reverse transcriptase zinc-binding domain-containing protein n=1 Tax=Solanum bulbocastanum TaxID=147425 RepID=A0AAN8YLF0_SOLBU